MSQARFRVLIVGVLVVLGSGMIGYVREAWTLLGQVPPERSEAWNQDELFPSPLARVGLGVGAILIGAVAWPRRRKPRAPGGAR